MVSAGCKDNFIFVEFEVPNIDFILLSKFKKFVLENQDYQFILVSSESLLPLANLYRSMFSTRVFVFDFRDPLQYIVEIITQHQSAMTVKHSNFYMLSIREAIIMECTLTGVNIHRISKMLGLDIKTIYHWRKSAEKKLSLKKMSNLRICL